MILTFDPFMQLLNITYTFNILKHNYRIPHFLLEIFYIYVTHFFIYCNKMPKFSLYAVHQLLTKNQTCSDLDLGFD